MQNPTDSTADMKYFKELKQNISLIIGKFTQLFSKLDFISDQLADLYDSVPKNQKTILDKEESLLTVARHTLGSIDLVDLEDPTPKGEDDFIAYTAQAAQFYDFFEKEAMRAIKMQHDWWFTNAENWDQTMFGRGTSNGIQLILDRIKELKDLHIQKLKKEEEPKAGSRESILARLQVGSDEPIDEQAN